MRWGSAPTAIASSLLPPPNGLWWR
jgi:hypothetical protein